MKSNNNSSDINENHVYIQETPDQFIKNSHPLKLVKEDSKLTHSAINFESEKDLMEVEQKQKKKHLEYDNETYRIKNKSDLKKEESLKKMKSNVEMRNNSMRLNMIGVGNNHSISATQSDV